MATVLPYNRAYDSWQNLPSIATPFTAQAMNTIEDGVENNRNYIIALEENFLSAVPTGETTLSLLQGMDADTERHFFTDVALADFPTAENHVWYLEIYKTSSNNLAFSNIILRDKTDGKSYVGTAEQNEVTWVEVGSGEGNASYLELTQSQYDALTPEQKNDGTIYFITNPTPSSVPSTIMASNVLYNGGSTLEVDNVADAVDDLTTRTENLADYEATAIASKPYLVGDLFLENNTLKKATQPIAQGGNITGSNSEDTTVGKEISRINSNFSDISAKVDLSGTHTAHFMLAKGGYGYAETTGISVPNMDDYNLNVSQSRVYSDSGLIDMKTLPEYSVNTTSDGFWVGVHNQTYCGYAGAVSYTLTKKA